MNDDLSSVAVLHECQSADIAGSVSLFRDLPTLVRAVEPVDVRNGEYLVYTLSGRRLDLGIENGGVRIAPSDGDEDCSAFVRRLLEYAADHVIGARKHRGDKGVEGLDPRTCSLDELVELIGFST